MPFTVVRTPDASLMASTFFCTQEGPVNALALNKDNTQVAIAGRNGKFKKI